MTSRCEEAERMLQAVLDAKCIQDEAGADGVTVQNDREFLALLDEIEAFLKG